jgi:hypothetical protein
LLARAVVPQAGAHAVKDTVPAPGASNSVMVNLFGWATAGRAQLAASNGKLKKPACLTLVMLFLLRIAYAVSGFH